MSEPNVNTLWGKVFVDELVKHGVEEVCIAPGSRSTPLTYAFATHPDVTVFSHLDERSAAYFALGRGKVSGSPTPVVSTSGTATANFHPAVIEADESRVPLLILTADRPPELKDSGANQTIDQEKIYGDSVRWYLDVAEPEVDGRKIRSLRVTAGRAVLESEKSPKGPVHLNFPFRKPLEPTEVKGDVPNEFLEENRLEIEGRRNGFVETEVGRSTISQKKVGKIADELDETDRGIIVAGPLDPYYEVGDSIATLSKATGFPVLADPLSGVRFGNPNSRVLGGYDSYISVVSDLLEKPEVVLRFGASPTSKNLRKYLESIETRQFIIDEAGRWREATFNATDLLETDPAWFASELANELGSKTSEAKYRDKLVEIESRYWELVENDKIFEGAVLREVIEGAPEGSTVFVSNSMPVRDLDRFGKPMEKDVTAIGNRGASGIDGVTSTALGAGSFQSKRDDRDAGELILVIGDLAYYHDMNGLLALERCGVEATIVLINNDGGGIFHLLPIEKFDPPFTEQFKTPHGLDFSPTSDLYGFDYSQVTGSNLEDFAVEYSNALDTEGSSVVEVVTDAEDSHRYREKLHETVCEKIEEEF